MSPNCLFGLTKGHPLSLKMATTIGIMPLAVTTFVWKLIVSTLFSIASWENAANEILPHIYSGKIRHIAFEIPTPLCSNLDA